MLGIIASGGSNNILIATGFAAAITESISMGAVGYTSTVAERDYYQAARQIVANRETWLETMMDEELHLQPVDSAAIVRTSVVITGATLIGHLIPLLPFLLLARTPALVVSVVLSASCCSEWASTPR
jgi:VIT1/CCC1 family predicted Fe2+/Mn2+ transporter